LIYPIFEEFKPEILFVSAGFDAAKGDPLGNCFLSSDVYAYMVQRLQELPNCRLVLALEGGYSLQNLKICSEAVVRSLLGECLPLQMPKSKTTLETMKRNCIPNKIA